MDIEKLIEQIAEEVYRKVGAQGAAASAVAAPAAGGKMSPAQVAAICDHTLLKPDATAEQVRKLCAEAAQVKSFSVCVNCQYVPLAAELLKGTGVKVCTVVGFPLGAMTTEAKAYEAIDAIAKGANEVDMVLNVGAAKGGDWDTVKRDVEALVTACRGKALLKVILETCLLTDEEKVKACTICKLAGADFVKTSTGFSTGGATIEDVRLMRSVVGPNMGVKASGGVRTYQQALAMIEAGASRIGTSNTTAIAQGDAPATGAAGCIGNCINCGRCTQACPTGTVKITKVAY